MKKNKTGFWLNKFLALSWRVTTGKHALIIFKVMLTSILASCSKFNKRKKV